MPGETNGTRDSKDRLEIIESIARIASFVAVPLVLAIVGWVIQGSLSRQAVGKDYVNMALSKQSRAEVTQILETSATS